MDMSVAIEDEIVRDPKQLCFLNSECGRCLQTSGRHLGGIQGHLEISQEKEATSGMPEEYKGGIQEAPKLASASKPGSI